METLSKWLCWIGLYYLTSHAELTAPLRWIAFGIDEHQRGRLRAFCARVMASSRGSGFLTGCLWPLQGRELGKLDLRACFVSGIVGMVVVSVGWKLLELLQFAHARRFRARSAVARSAPVAAIPSEDGPEQASDEVTVARWEASFPAGTYCDLCNEFICPHTPFNLYRLGLRLPAAH